MAKQKSYKVKDYYSRWAANEIAEDMNELARQGYVVEFAFPIDFHNEVNRHPDPQPGLNDGDHISSAGTMRLIFAR